jgi:uncharacterized repeat protein (TIGR03837 family)
MPLSWDIFCTVIDNFGDIGVCWRLARQIAAERGEAVRLWVDDLAAFHTLEPRITPVGYRQQWDGVDICHWQGSLAGVVPNRVVIEAFACNPSDDFLAAMARQPIRPVWINLEYLSAEDWVQACHLGSGKHPRLGMTRHFFFPGFTDRTGGLLREASLLRSLPDPVSQTTFLQQFGLPAHAADTPRISLFCYDNPALPGLLDHWARHARPMTLLVAAGLAHRQVAHWLGESFTVGHPIQRGPLTLLAIPFLSQRDYDQLLASCSLNFVRGEDSFVRAQWAGQALVWHIYPQDDDAHRIKLDAFMRRYTETLDTASTEALLYFWQGWNAGNGDDVAAAWLPFSAALPALANHAATWRDRLSTQPDLLSQLASFAAAHLSPDT